MKRHIARATSLLGLLGLMGLASAGAATPALQSELLQEAQRWSDKNRSDIARQKIAKLLAVEPGSPEGLAFLGDMALRENKLDEARSVLSRLQVLHPEHPATRDLELLYRIYTQQREQLTRMRLAARAGRSAEAAAQARALFPNGAPRYGALGREIAQILGTGGPALAVATAPSTKATTTRTGNGTAKGNTSRNSQVAAATGKPPVATETKPPQAQEPATTPATTVAATTPAATEEPSAAPTPTAAELAAARADSLRTQAQTQMDAGQTATALPLLQEAVQLVPDDPWARHALARAYLQQKAPQQARSVMDEGIYRLPNDTDMRYARALILAAVDDDAAALADLQQIAVAERTDGMRELEQRVQAHQLSTQIALEARRQSWIEVGQQTLQKNSTEGLSSLRGWERPVVAWMPWNDGAARVFAHVDTVQLDAGSYAGGDFFGQPGSETITSGIPQQAQGANVGVGYQGDAVRWDIGETGVGFAVTNWVGGLRYAGEIGSTDYSVELSRRPLTGTLLSYAGTRDPLTGAVWGGVVATGVSGRVARDFGPYSTSLSLGAATLTGQNVADNTRLRWRAAVDRDVYRSDTQTVNLGLAVSGLQHDKDLSGFTWGQGGYYSPNHNLTVSLPVEWSGREGRFTWSLRGSVSMSNSSSNASDYYPTNAAMQQYSRTYAAGSSSGTGWSVNGAAEYQVTPQLAIGGRLEREVSDYYTPLNLLFYLRYDFTPSRAPLALRPRPVQAYSQF